MKKKAFAALALCAALAFSLCGMVACADNSEQVIRDSLTEEIESLKNPDEATLAELSSSLPTSVFAQLGLSTTDVMKALLEGFDGTVDSVEVDGKNAVATLTISSRDFSQLDTVLDDMTDEMTDNAELADMSLSERTAWAGQMLMQRIESLPVVQHDPTSVEYVLNGNTWEPAPGAQSKLASAIFG